MRYVRTYPDELPELARRLPEIETPVLIIAGGRDRVVPAANAEFLSARLPHSRLVVIDAGHFVWEEAAGEYASTIADWVAGHRQAAAQTRESTRGLDGPTRGSKRDCDTCDRFAEVEMSGTGVSSDYDVIVLGGRPGRALRGRTGQRGPAGRRGRA